MVLETLDLSYDDSYYAAKLILLHKSYVSFAHTKHKYIETIVFTIRI